MAAGVKGKKRSVARKSRASKALSPFRTELTKPLARVHAASIDKEAIAPEDRWVAPSHAANVIGMSEKYLAALREGRKDIEGPPFKKLGNSKTSPVRYNLAQLRDWINSFPTQVRTFCAAPSPIMSASDFFTGRNLDSRWLFAEVDGDLVDFFQALNGNVFERSPETQLHWLNTWEWLQRSASTPAFQGAVASALAPLRARALSMYEEKLLEVAVNPAAARRKTPRT